jgi:hypothetical protein
MKKEAQKIPAAKSVIASGDELKKVEEPKRPKKKRSKPQGETPSRTSV